MAVDVAIENQWDSDEPNPTKARNHSQQTLTDALAVYAVLSGLDPALSTTESKAIPGSATMGMAAGIGGGILTEAARENDMRDVA